MATHGKTLRTYNDPENPWLSDKGPAHTQLEKPALYALCPDLEGRTVLSVGCGAGEECEYIGKKGAAHVVGIDLSSTMINEAQRRYPQGEYHVMDMEDISLPARTFDLVVSSLAMHYVEDWTKPLMAINRVLKDDGTFLFSTHHPVYWGADWRSNRLAGRSSHLLGFHYTWRIGPRLRRILFFARGARGLPNPTASAKVRVFGDYLNVRCIEERWYGRFEVVFYHKPFSAMLADIRRSGFDIEDCVEPTPLEELRGSHPDLYEIWSKVPLFLIFVLKKSSKCSSGESAGI